MSVISGPYIAWDMKRKGLKRGIRYEVLEHNLDGLKWWEKVLGLQMIRRPELQCYVVDHNKFTISVDRYDKVHDVPLSRKNSWIWDFGFCMPIPFMKRNHYVFITTRYR